jgi:hypothetical protein
LNCTFSSLFHNRAALLALGNAFPNCKHVAKGQAAENSLGNAVKLLIRKDDMGSVGK